MALSTANTNVGTGTLSGCRIKMHKRDNGHNFYAWGDMRANDDGTYSVHLDKERRPIFFAGEVWEVSSVNPREICSTTVGMFTVLEVKKNHSCVDIRIRKDR